MASRRNLVSTSQPFWVNSISRPLLWPSQAAWGTVKLCWAIFQTLGGTRPQRYTGGLLPFLFPCTVGDTAASHLKLQQTAVDAVYAQIPSYHDNFAKTTSSELDTEDEICLYEPVQIPLSGLRISIKSLGLGGYLSMQTCKLEFKPLARMERRKTARSEGLQDTIYDTEAMKKELSLEQKPGVLLGVHCILLAVHVISTLFHHTSQQFMVSPYDPLASKWRQSSVSTRTSRTYADGTGKFKSKG
ncbi:hypothetical protein VKT23_005057 [Stygiomarasmius scandens]|uniref:Uncharacterized protein n=1 Tax=Marasmiellus scandens TaxID=2682957 RepID=A0ABR1JSV3_9AGAR